MKRCPSCNLTMPRSEWHCSSCGWEPATAGRILVLASPRQESAEGFSPDYFEELARLEPGHFWFRARNKLILWAVDRYLREAGRFMEIGCGTGFVLQALHTHRPDLALTGSELFLEGLQVAVGRVPAVEFLQLDAGSLPFFDHFDGIGAFDVLEHISDDLEALMQFHQVLRPGGFLFLTVPQHQWLWSVNDEHACHCRRYERRQLLAKVRQAGFRILRTTSFVSLLLPLLCASRMKRNVQKKFDPLEEFSIAPWKQRMLGWAMQVEFALIRLGMNWPMGGSLLLIAEKPDLSAPGPGQPDLHVWREH